MPVAEVGGGGGSTAIPGTLQSLAESDAVRGEAILEALLTLLGPDDIDRVRTLVERGRRHEERLQLLQQVSSALVRSLDEDDILSELMRGVQRTLRCDAVVVARIDLDRSEVQLTRCVAGEAELTPRIAALGDGPLAEAARTGTPVLVSPYDAALSPLAAADDVAGGIPDVRAVLAVPMMHGRRLLGVVAALDARDDAFDLEARELLATLATHAGASLSNARLFAESERERRQSDAMAEIARAVGESLRKGEVMRLILRHAVALLQAEGACIALRDDGYLHVVSSLGIADVLLGVHLPVGGSLSGRVASSGVAMVTNELGAEPQVHRPSMRLISATRAVIVPLVTARGIIGTLSVYNGPDDFSADDARVLQRLADQVAVTIVNARLFEEVQEATREWLAAFESIGVGMCIVDDEGRITRFNSRAMHLAAQETPRTLQGRAFYDVFLGAPPELEEDALARAIREGINARAVAAGANGRAFDIVAAPHPSGGAIVTFEDVSAQHASWDQHRHVFEGAAEALVTIDSEGCVALANAAARQLFRRDELAGVRWLDLLLHEMAEEARSHLHAALDGATLQHEYVVVRGDGDRRVVAAKVAPLRDGSGSPAVVVSMHDVSGERRAREAVAHSEARYRHLFDATSDAVFTLDFRGVFTSANPAAGTAFGAAGEQLLGRSLYPFLGGGDVDRVTTFLRDSLNGESLDFDCVVTQRGGERRTLAITTSPLRQGRAVIGILAVARDVTEERQREVVPGSRQARFDELVEGATDVIFTLDEEGNFTSVNAAFEAATGLVRNVVQGGSFTLALDPRDRDAMWEAFVSALHGRRQRGELRFTDGRGASWWGGLVASPMVERGRVVGVLFVVRDRSTEHRLVEALLQQGRPPSVEQWRELQLSELASTVLGERRERFARAGIVTSLEVETDLPSCCGDVGGLTRAVALVLDGAHAALERRGAGGRVALRAARRGDRVTLSVEDDAPALSEEERARAFSPYSGVRPVPPGRDGLAGESSGAALGLAAAQAIVRQHGGRLALDLTDAGTNVFTLEIPAIPSPSGDVAPPAARTSNDGKTWPTA